MTYPAHLLRPLTVSECQNLVEITHVAAHLNLDNSEMQDQDVEQWQVLVELAKTFDQAYVNDPKDEHFTYYPHFERWHPSGATYYDTIAAYATIMLLDIYGSNDDDIARTAGEEYDELCPNMPLEAMTAQAATIKQTLLDAVHGRS